MEKGKKNKSIYILISAIVFVCLWMPIKINAAEKMKTVKVGFFQFKGFHEIDSEGNKSGYGYEYLQHMAGYSNWKYKYIGYDKSWAEMLHMLESGEIDMLLSVRKTPEREKKFDFSNVAIGTSCGLLTVKEGNHQYQDQDYSKMQGIRVGLLRENSRNKDFALYAKEKGFSYHPVYYNSEEELTNALQEGKDIDASVTGSLRALNNEWILDEFAVTQNYIAVKKGNTKLLNEINQIMEDMDKDNPELQKSLKGKYYSSQNSKLSFNAEEREYIEELKKNKQVLYAVLNSDRKPLSYIENGTPKGIIARLMEEIKEKTGLPIKIIETSDRQEYEEKKKAENISLILDVDYDYNEAEKKNYKLTEPYIRARISQLTTRSNNKKIRTIAAVQNGDITEEYIEKKYKRNQIVYYHSIEQCIDAVLKGKQDAAYMYDYVAQYAVYKDITNVLNLHSIPEYRTKFSIAVKNGEDARLISILNKTIQSLSDDRINQMIIEETDYPAQPFSIVGYIYENPFLAGTVIISFFVLVLIAILFGFHIKNMKDEKKRLNEFQRFIFYVCKMNDEVMELDLNSSICCQYQLSNGNVIQNQYKIKSFEEFCKNFADKDLEDVKKYFNYEVLKHLVDTGEILYFECKERQKDGSSKWFSFGLQGLKRDELHPNNVMILKQNIDEFKREEELHQQLLQEALEKARQAGEAKGRFMSTMSHEMRTPLNGMLGCMEIMKRYIDQPDKIQEYMDKAKQSANHLMGIINDVLDMASIESGKMKLEVRNFILGRLLSEVMEIFEESAEKKHLHLELQYVDETLKEEVLKGDDFRVKQILINLLSNGVKFTPEGGHVILNVGRVQVQKEHEYIRFEISDTGIGMSEEYLVHLFEPFEQQDGSIARRFGGTGLGLPITKNLIDMMQGDIGVRSQEGKGTTFIVELPFFKEKETIEVKEPKEDTVEGEISFAGKKALVAEDNDLNAEIVQVILNEKGFEVVRARNGREAAEIFETSQLGEYDVILMDIQMPDMDGYEATAQIRESARPDGQTIPIFAMTADAFTSDVSKALAAGMNYHIAKPIKVDEMMKVLKEYLC